VISITLLAIIAGLLGYGTYQLQSVMDSVQSISTPPPVVTDSTYYEPTDPEGQAPPLTVDTAAAQTYLEDQRETGELPAVEGSGFFGSVGSLASTSGDMVMSGASALGVGDDGSEAITILMMGVDARPGSPIDIGVRPDVITVLRLDPVTSSCRALSIPRDTRVEIPGYGESKINHALMVGGIPYQLRVTEEFLDIEIDNYLLVDFVAFQQIIDTLGGVTVEVPEDLAQANTGPFVKGTQDMDGATALSYARYRSFDTDGDYGRVDRQWGILEGIADEVRGQDMVGLASDLLATVKQHIRTDLTAEQLTSIARTYGEKCAASTRDDIAILQGSRIDLPDPMTNEIGTFNVVADNLVADAVTELYSPEPQTTPSAPAASPEASPELGMAPLSPSGEKGYPGTG
jgi:LCP family protein required for cell wall assembly